jgi:uncharacterized protein (TIGR02118 family)
MVTVSILYPRSDGARFDFDYYVGTHMPMSIRLLGDAMTAVSVERGVSLVELGSAPAFVAATHFTCASREAFEAAFLPHAEALQGDMPNYTDIVPIIQFNDVALTKQGRG